ncbi:hypothetical protein [Agriterribacter sp.]|uniref:hypothetical protein n=1 Tax=Agriterribacter sp. TaxID=2821509 RepID=UPI002B59D72D|nr:hypothetical protein [Agriterribacter sp.]HRO44480.1 hypothetical protein [Agriterribacter sp.]HRQ16494.1 hypothetical protein [Agriterribacter sp.]
MKKIHLLAILIAATFSTQNLNAQDSTANFKPKTVSVEEMVGGKRQFLQLLVNKVFAEKKKIGLLSISSYAADYKDNLSNNEFQNTTLIYHHLFKGVSINSGVSFTSIEGLKNFIGLQYMYQSKTLSLIYMPSYYFINSHKISNFALIEYKPAINEKWAVYSRLQLHYNHDLENGNHFRSYAYSRLGLTYKYFSFGLANNYDRYGANKSTKNNYGVFIKLTL